MNIKTSHLPNIRCACGDRLSAHIFDDEKGTVGCMGDLAHGEIGGPVEWAPPRLCSCTHYIPVDTEDATSFGRIIRAWTAPQNTQAVARMQELRGQVLIDPRVRYSEIRATTYGVLELLIEYGSALQGWMKAS